MRSAAIINDEIFSNYVVALTTNYFILLTALSPYQFRYTSDLVLSVHGTAFISPPVVTTETLL